MLFISFLTARALLFGGLPLCLGLTLSAAQLGTPAQRVAEAPVAHHDALASQAAPDEQEVLKLLKEHPCLPELLKASLADTQASMELHSAFATYTLAHLSHREAGIDVREARRRYQKALDLQERSKAFFNQKNTPSLHALSKKIRAHPPLAQAYKRCIQASERHLDALLNYGQSLKLREALSLVLGKLCQERREIKNLLEGPESLCPPGMMSQWLGRTKEIEEGHAQALEQLVRLEGKLPQISASYKEHARRLEEALGDYIGRIDALLQ